MPSGCPKEEDDDEDEHDSRGQIALMSVLGAELGVGYWTFFGHWSLLIGHSDTGVHGLFTGLFTGS